MKKNRGKSLLLFSIILISCFFTICIASIVILKITNFTPSYGAVTIDDVVLTTDIDTQMEPVDSVTKFSPQQPQIYCFVKLSSPKAISVGVRWFFEEELIYDDRAVVNGYRAFFIQPVSGETFPEGNYKVEVYLVQDAEKTLEFTVER